MYVLKQNVLNYATTDCYAYQFLGVAHVPSLRWPMPHLQSQQWYINSFSYHFIPNSSSATFRKSCDYTGPMWITPSFPGGSVGRIHLQMQEIGLIPGSGRSPAEGNGNPLQYSWQSHKNIYWRTLDTFQISSPDASSHPFLTLTSNEGIKGLVVVWFSH